MTKSLSRSVSSGSQKDEDTFFAQLGGKDRRDGLSRLAERRQVCDRREILVFPVFSGGYHSGHNRCTAREPASQNQEADQDIYRAGDASLQDFP